MTSTDDACTPRLHRSTDFRLASGAVLPELVQSHLALGTLNAAGDNAVIVLHGLTTGPSMLAPGAFAAEGAWSDLVGPGKAIDTGRFFVVCPNALGSSYGTTGPASTDPRTGKPYGTTFPDMTVGDMIEAQKLLLDHYGVTRLAAAVGPSMGGYQAFEWGVAYPDFVQRVVAAVTCPYHRSPIASEVALRETLSKAPAWRDGAYVDTPGSMQPYMKTMRVATLKRYGLENELAAAFPDPAAREAEIERLAAGWAAVFDPNALMTLTRACDRFDVRPRLRNLRAPVLYVNSRTDVGFPPGLALEVLPILEAAGVKVRYIELDSDKGHLASGADAALWSDDLKRFLEQPV
ncbi:alpha/beta fold hydrolase [Scleromatobacter humisilvae]|uniref:Alpha/beta fold hydrolase n=1 Tax=Scleromatobacter humisilvae TaxID=2897159 RepID=A0A9X1YSS3_9BURK|nr:alpha/beta fold hydrolase [Scleromatobacter humisilvae]MCK9688851.1 alpha/beta fold hydrolase [Scleromatobacter humisilvae]